MRLRRPLKIAGWMLGGLLSLVLLAVLGLWGAANTERGQAWIAAALEDVLSAPGAPATVSGLRGPLPQDARLARLVLRDRDGAWLTLEDVRLSWSPLALLSGRLELQAVTAERFALDRLPAGDGAEETPEEAADTGAFALPDLPVAIRLDRLAIAQLEIGEALAGTAAAFEVTGQAAAPQGGRLTTQLTVTRQGGPAESLRLTAGFDPASRDLTADLTLDAPPDGLLAQLADLPAGAGAALSLTGGGPIDAWEGQLNARIGAAARVETAIRLTDFNRLALEGDAAAPGYLTGELASLVGGPVRFDLAVARDGDAGATIERGRIETETLRADLSGGIAPDGSTVDAAVELTVRDPAPLNALAAPAEIAGLSARLTARGALAAPEIRLTARADAAGVPEAGARNVTVDLRYNPADAITRGQAQVELSGAESRFAIDALSHYDGHPISARLDGRLDLEAMTLSRASLSASLRDLRASLDGRADLAGPSGDAAFDLQLANLTQLGPVVPLGLSGQGSLSGHVRFAAAGGDQGGPLVDATVMGDLRQVGAEIPLLAALLGERVQLATDLSVGRDGGLTLTQLSLDSPNARIRGKFALPGDFASLDGDFTATVPQAGVLAPALNLPLAGMAELSAQLTGALNDPDLQASLQLNQAAVAGQGLGTARLRADVRGLASGPRGKLQLETTEGPAGPLDAETRFAIAADTLGLTAIDAQIPGLAVRSDRLDVPLAGGALAGTLQIASDRLRPLLTRVAGIDADAAADLSVTLGPDGTGGQQVQLAGAVTGVALPGGGPTVERIELDGTIADAFAAPEADVTATLRRAAAGPLEMARLSVTARGTPDDLDVSAEGEGRGQGTLDQPIALSLQGNLGEDGAARVVTLDRLRLAVGQRTVSLARPASVRLQGPEIAVKDVALDVGDGRITLDARRGRERVELTLDADRVPLSYSRLALAEPQLVGRLNARAQISGPLDGPTGAVNLTLAEVGSEGTDLPPLDAQMDLRLNDARRLIANGRITGLGDRPLQITANLPVDFALAPGFTAGLRPDDGMQGRIAWTGEVAPLMPLVPATGHRLTGRANLDFQLAGTPGDPELSGEARLAGARYENLDTGTLLTDLEARLRATGQRIEIARFTAQDGGDGTLDITGGLDLPKPGEPSRIEVNVDARSAKLARLDFLVADADVDLDVTGSLADMLIAGTVTVNEAEARIPDNLPPEVGDLQVVSEQELRARRAAEAEAAKAGRPAQPAQQPSRTELDIAIDVPGQTFVRGNGLDSEWQGNLLVTGTANQPVVRGQLQAVRGRVSLLNKTFNLERGQVAFSGGREINPRLDIRAVNESPDLTAIVLVKGNATQPSFELSSVPELPQEQVLSRLLFGKTPGELGPVESAQLAAAVAELSFSGGGPGVIDRLRSFVGVDVLQIGGSAESGPTVEAGKYVTEDVFVGVEQGAGIDSSQVKIEVDVTDNIKLESAAGVSGGSSVGVQFHWDY